MRCIVRMGNTRNNCPENVQIRADCYLENCIVGLRTVVSADFSDTLVAGVNSVAVAWEPGIDDSAVCCSG